MAESFRSSLDPGISERTNAPLSFFLFFIFIFLPSSRVDLFKGPRLIDPRDPGATCLDVCGINRATPGDLCSRLAGMKRAETRKSKSFRHSRVSLTPTIHRDENVSHGKIVISLPIAKQMRICKRWSHVFQVDFLSYYSILYGVDGFVRRYNLLSASKIIIYPSFNNNYRGDQWWFSLRWSSYRILTNDIDSV